MITLKKTKKYTIYFDVMTARGNFESGVFWTQHDLHSVMEQRYFLYAIDAIAYAESRLSKEIGGFSAYVIYDQSDRLCRTVGRGNNKGL